MRCQPYGQPYQVNTTKVSNKSFFQYDCFSMNLRNQNSKLLTYGSLVNSYVRIHVQESENCYNANHERQ